MALQVWFVQAYGAVRTALQRKALFIGPQTIGHECRNLIKKPLVV